MAKKFSDLQDGSIISSIRQRKLEDALFDIKDSEEQGADGFLLHVELLDEEFRNIESIKKIIDSTTLPLMVLNYRKEKDVTIEDDIRLNEFKLECVKNGAAAVDIPANTFDFDSQKSLIGSNVSFEKENPLEISLDKEVVERQKRLIEDIHKFGGEVLMSAHIKTWLNKEQTFELAQIMADRGADIIKIINWCKSVDNIPEMLQTSLELKRTLGKQVLYQPNDCYGKLLRKIMWMFGSTMILCHNRYTGVSLRNKPLISDVKKAKELLTWE